MPLMNGPLLVGTSDRPLLADFCRSRPPNELVKSDANAWSARMQISGQVRAISHRKLEGMRKRDGALSWGLMHQSAELYLNSSLKNLDLSICDIPPGGPGESEKSKP